MKRCGGMLSKEFNGAFWIPFLNTYLHQHVVRQWFTRGERSNFRPKYGEKWLLIISNLKLEIAQPLNATFSLKKLQRTLEYIFSRIIAAFLEPEISRYVKFSQSAVTVSRTFPLITFWEGEETLFVTIGDYSK